MRVHHLDPSLDAASFSFKTSRPRGFRFTAGQFARLGVKKANGTVAWRAYSMVSGPYDDHLEFYSIVVPGGEFTTELARLRVGDPLFIDKQNHGFLTLSRFSGGTDLWLLSTGTGIAPFLSMLRDPDAWQAYGHIVLVHSVRHPMSWPTKQPFAAFPAMRSSALCPTGSPISPWLRGSRFQGF